MAIFESRREYPVPVEELFGWHARPGALARLTPPWQPARVVAQSGGIAAGARVELILKLGPVPVRWLAHHTEYTENRHFRDVQVQGPFARWVHDHLFEETATGSRLTDRVEYRLPFGPFGQLFGGSFAARELARIFRYRQQLLAYDLARHARFRACGRRRIRLSGTREPLGGALAALLGTGGHEVTRAATDVAPIEAPEAWIHLVDPDAPADLERVVRAAAGLDRKPDVFIAVAADGGASADRYWRLTGPSRAADIRTVLLTVPSLLEGHLSRAPGDRWLAQEDVLGLVLHALFTEQLSGPIAASATAPEGPLAASGFRYLFTDRQALRRWVSGVGY
jgi:ligand-binding SRPBCC domain-containing protein